MSEPLVDGSILRFHITRVKILIKLLIYIKLYLGVPSTLVLRLHEIPIEHEEVIQENGIVGFYQ
jgi:hypothetical protein